MGNQSLDKRLDEVVQDLQGKVDSAYLIIMRVCDRILLLLVLLPFSPRPTQAAPKRHGRPPPRS